MDRKREKRNEIRTDISVMRIVATLAVVLIHTGSTILSIGKVEFGTWKGEFFECISYICMWAVPIFLMVTGALMLRKDKKITSRECITKYAKRAVLALFVFGVPFTIIQIFFETGRIDVFGGIVGVLTGKTWDHLWYLYLLIGIYLLLPIFKIFTEYCSKEMLRYVLAVLFIFNFCVPFLSNIIDCNFTAFYVPVTFAMFHILFGFYTDNYFEMINKKLILGALCALIITHIVLTIVFPYDKLFFISGRMSPISALIAMAVFCLMKGIKISKSVQGILWNIDRLCFGVYLIHPLFIHFTYRFLNVMPTDFNLYPLMTLVFWIIFTVLSFVASFIMSRIPVLKKWVL